jgi:hypothetical protein
MFKADERLRVVPHPTVGRACVAARRVRRGERLYFWGNVVSVRDETPANSDYLITSPRGMVIDPTPFGDASRLQYVNAPGPNERANITHTGRDVRRRVRDGVGRQRVLASVEFRALRAIARGEQLLWDYDGDEWFEERGLTRVDVDVAARPAV